MRVAFLHGFMGSALNWGRIRGLLEKTAGVQTAAYDLLGHAQNHPSESERSQGHQAMVARLAKDLETFRPTHVVAHSFGLRPALILGVSRPELVPHLIVEDSSPELSPSAFDYLMDILNSPVPFRTREAAKSYFEAKFGVQSELARFFMSNIRSRPDGQSEWRFDKAFLESLLHEATRMPLWQQWTAYKGQAQLVYGELSHSLNSDLIRRMKEMKPALPVHCVKGAGHWIHSDKPEAFVELLERILK